MADLAANGKPIESVWDYPRPPRVERVDWRIRVEFAGATIVDAPHALRVLETSQPPAYYIAEEHIDLSRLRPSAHRTVCEWKGIARYADVVVGDRTALRAAWSYPSARPPFDVVADHWAFYAQTMDRCLVDDEVVAPNEGSFYGGWITANVTGPFKGGPGTSHW